MKRYGFLITIICLCSGLFAQSTYSGNLSVSGNSFFKNYSDGIDYYVGGCNAFPIGTFVNVKLPYSDDSVNVKIVRRIPEDGIFLMIESRAGAKLDLESGDVLPVRIEVVDFTPPPLSALDDEELDPEPEIKGLTALSTSEAEAEETIDETADLETISDDLAEKNSDEITSTEPVNDLETIIFPEDGLDVEVEAVEPETVDAEIVKNDEDESKSTTTEELVAADFEFESPEPDTFEVEVEEVDPETAVAEVAEADDVEPETAVAEVAEADDVEPETAVAEVVEADDVEPETAVAEVVEADDVEPETAVAEVVEADEVESVTAEVESETTDGTESETAEIESTDGETETAEEEFLTEIYEDEIPVESMFDEKLKIGEDITEIPEDAIDNSANAGKTVKRIFFLEPANKKPPEGGIPDEKLIPVSTVDETKTISPGYYLQVGVYRESESVKRDSETLKNMNFPYITVNEERENGRELLLVGPVTNDELGVIMLHLESRGFDDFFRYRKKIDN